MLVGQTAPDFKWKKEEIATFYLTIPAFFTTLFLKVFLLFFLPQKICIFYVRGFEVYVNRAFFTVYLWAVLNML